ncbi:hypothetical protein PRSY57_0714000 [Plasmodium reichenowi]|uniref:Uncharacterized protein n=1 Tax=Plasmodium reichenowi TaxID=5854 RepID=A0A151LMS9_PLARE|nr:hypothetical protein PRSY57_0714000 [Plasmodium reichenowi]KYO00472.1 hypothetical protein PRSY57_0714000 [Plasmodium reichenowi]
MTKCKNELRILKDSIKKKIDVYKYNEKNDFYIKYKSLIHRCDKQIDIERIRLGSYLFKKDEAYMNEKDINKLLNKIIKKKIAHEYIWNRIKNMIFKFNLVNVDNKNITSLSTNSSSSLTYIMNNKKNIFFYNKCYDHINVYLLSIALQVINKRNSTFFNFLYSYINAFFANMEPRHFLHIFYILVKNTYRDLNKLLNNNHTNKHDNHNSTIHIEECQLSNINHTLFVKQKYAHHIYYSQKNFIELLTKYCIDKINYFSFNDIGLICDALTYFSLKQNPFVEYWNEFLLYIFDIHNKVNQKNMPYAQKGEDKIYEREKNSINEKYEREKNSINEKYEREKNSINEIYEREKNSINEIYEHEKNSINEKYSREKNSINEKYSREQNSQNEKYSREQNSQNEKYSHEQNSQNEKYPHEQNSQKIKKNSFFSDNPSEKKHEPSESFIKRKMKAFKKIDHSFIDYDKYIELNGKNILSILKYIVSYYEVYPCIKKVANRISIILVNRAMDLTLHECSEILYHLNRLSELDQIMLKDKISIYEYQLKDTFLTTYDIGCLLKIAQVLNEQNYYDNIPFLHIFLYNIHKFSLENASLLFDLICKNYENEYMRDTIVEEVGGEVYQKKKGNSFRNNYNDKLFMNNKSLLKGLCTLLISYEDIIRNMSYKEMFFLCEILNKEKLFVHTSILGYISNRLCSDIEKYRCSLLNFPSYVDYIMFIAIFIYNNKYNDDKLLNNIYSIFLCNNTDYMLSYRNRIKNKIIYHYCFYLLCIQKDMRKCVPYLNFILKSVSLFEPMMLYYIILIYFYKSAKNKYKHLFNRKHIKMKKRIHYISFSNSKDIIRSNINMNHPYSLYKPVNVFNQQEFDEELLRLFLPMWNVMLPRRGRKMLDFLIMLNKFYDNINVRHYLFNKRVIRKVERYINLVHEKNKINKINKTNTNIKFEENMDYDKYSSCVKNSGFIILCDDPIIKEPVLFDIHKLQLIKIERNNISKNQMYTNDCNKEKKIKESINYLLNDYKYKKDIIIKKSSTKYSKPAKYFENYKRGTSVQQFLSIYDD